MSAAPPPWTATVVRAVLADDPMRDAILGDLHEEFAADVARRGPAGARARHRRRTAGVLAHAVVDALCWRAWGSTTPPAAPRPAARAPRAAGGGRVGGPDVAVGLAAFAVLALGVVGNTALFAAARGGRPGAPAGAAAGVGGVALAVACAGAAALVLCLGPRWLRRRRAARPAVR